MSRFPFPIPFGWFHVAYPDELVPGTVKPLMYFGQELVAWRNNAGEVVVQDAYCPHLGAHLGYGGFVDDKCIRCPFHHWAFDPQGACTNIPYSDRLNRKARVFTYPVIERNGFVMAWYHPHREAPSFEIPELIQYNNDEWTSYEVHDFTIDSVWQEMSENSVDGPHFRYVHRTGEVPTIERYDTDGPFSKMESKQVYVTPRGNVVGNINVTAYGPGLQTTLFSGIIDTFLVSTTTAITDERSVVRFHFQVRKSGDEHFTKAVGDAFVKMVCDQIREDMPIWEHKDYLPVPALADTDGPIMQYRKWAAQFYAN